MFSTRRRGLTRVAGCVRSWRPAVTTRISGSAIASTAVAAGVAIPIAVRTVAAVAIASIPVAVSAAAITIMTRVALWPVTTRGRGGGRLR